MLVPSTLYQRARSVILGSVSNVSEKPGQKFLMSNYFITHIIEIKYSYNCNDNPTMVLDG